ncbi:MAG: hypothetical protein WDM90_15530 [Ferruginibacter sp.]
MKKLTFAIILFFNLSNSIAQIKPIIRLPKTDDNKILPIVTLDEGLVAATESIIAKMKEVVNKANGFKNDKLTEVYNSTKVKGYYRNTNNVNGAIYYNPLRKKSVFIYGEIRKFFDTQGGSNSYIDYPVNDISNIKSGFDGQYGESATFEGACVTVNSKRKLQAVFGEVYEKYRMLGGATSNLGFPVSDRAKYASTAYAQVFEGGIIIINNTTAYVITGAMAKKYNYADCGLPLGDAVTEKTGSQLKLLTIVTTQKFEKNTIVSSTKTKACFVKNDIYKKWMTYGNAINNTCGLPTSDAVENVGMTAQNFEKGLMLLVNGKVTFVPDDSEKNTQENNKIRQTNRLDIIKFAPIKIQ